MGATYAFAQPRSGAIKNVEEVDGSPSCYGYKLIVSNTTLTDNADGTCTVTTGGGGANHALLSTTHTDTLAGTVVRGDLIIGNATPAWARVALGANNTFLGSNGTDAAWTATSGTGLAVGTGRTLTGGVGIAALGDLSADRTVTFDATEISSLTWGAGAFTTMTFNSGATQPSMTFGNGTITITPGGTDLIIADDVESQDPTPHYRWTDTTAAERDFEAWADANAWFLSDITNAVQLIIINAANDVTFAGSGTFGNTGMSTITQGLRVNQGSTSAEADDFVVNSTGTVSEFEVDAGDNKIYMNGVVSTTAAGVGILGADNGTGLEIRMNATQANCTAADVFIDFRSTSGSEGSVACTATAGLIAYNTQTMSHWTEVQDRQGLAPLMLLCSTGKRVTFKKEYLTQSAVCTHRQDPAAYGVYGGTDKEGHDFVLSGGTGYALVANRGEDLAVGDYLISSDVPGRAERQADDIYHNYTVAKCMERVQWNVGETERKVAVIYEGG